MTHKQRIIVVVLLIANLIVVLAVVLLVTHLPAHSPSLLPTPAPKSATPPPASPDPSPTPLTVPDENAASSRRACQRKGAEQLAQTGLGGAVTLAADGTLRFDITHELGPQETIDDAAQLVWTVFDVALVLEEQCSSPIHRVEATILAKGSQTETWIDASVRMASLAAFARGELDEEAFIEHVTYTITQR